MAAHIFTYDLHRMRCSRSSLARSDTASAALAAQMRLKCIKQPREDLLSVVAFKIIEAHRWSTLSVPNDSKKDLMVDRSSVSI